MLLLLREHCCPGDNQQHCFTWPDFSLNWILRKTSEERKGWKAVARERRGKMWTVRRLWVRAQKVTAVTIKPRPLNGRRASSSCSFASDNFNYLPKCLLMPRLLLLLPLKNSGWPQQQHVFHWIFQRPQAQLDGIALICKCCLEARNAFTNGSN